MADDKGITLLNRGQRHFDLGAGADKKPLRHSPGATHSYSAEEGAKLAKMYPKELVDISKLPGAVDSRQMKADLDKANAENAALKAQLAALPKASALEAPAPVAPEAPLKSGPKNK